MTESCLRRVSAIVSAVFAASGAWAQPASAPAAQPFVTKPIVVSPVTADEKKELVILAVSIQAGGAVPMHTHPGDCVGSVVEGTVELVVDGQAPRRVAAGEAYSNLRGAVHGFRNVGDTPARLLNTLLVDKGAPRVQPAVPSAKP